MKVEGTHSVYIGSRPNERLCCSKKSEINLHFADKRESTDASLQDRSGGLFSSEGGIGKSRLKGGCSSLSLSWQNEMLPIVLIIKRHKIKFKVKYRDIKDADDDARNLEVIYDKFTEESTRFGFITMCTAEDAPSVAQQFNGYEFEGRQLRVNGGPPLRGKILHSEDRGEDGRQVLIIKTEFMWETFHGMLRIFIFKPSLVSNERLWMPRWFMTERVVDQRVSGS
ncbi:unnamed protein product [Fraxinus pennsylvanica]|uniref:RRM domain-containing protein n=1 Tax=Fraxinus pennsylvanica TaxID=56036 RepID=A0AAD2DIL6_9LAMI|nr:unnamed protein product [Fraxinus pennsylvanica]